MAQIPAAVGLFVCEQVVVEEGTSNVTLVNCFRRRPVSEFPSRPMPFAVYAVLRDGSGDIRLDFAIERIDTAEAIYEVSATARFLDQTQEWRYLGRIRDCSFPVAGTYEAVLFANGELIAQRRFRITKKESSQ